VSWFTSYRSHYFVGFLRGLTLRGRQDIDARAEIVKLDLWAFDREWRQNLAGKHPDPQLSARQLREAAAWGAGARYAVDLNVPYPTPPYPDGYRWS